MSPLHALRGLAAVAVLVLCASAWADDPAVSYDKVVQLLKDELKEDEIIRLVRQSPTKFTLGADQIAELKRLGASDKLIRAMRENGPADVGKTDTRAVVVILDCSGSMQDKIPGGGDKWAAARQAALDLIDSVPDGRAVGLIVYGHEIDRQCQACDVLRPLTAVDADGKAAMRAAIGKLRAVGHTPIALALQKAGEELAKTTALARVVLITDGMETCHGDPVKEAQALRGAHKHLAGIDVVGFALKPEETKAVGRIADAGGGKFYTAQTANELAKQMRAVRKEITVAAAPDPVPAGDDGDLSAADRDAMYVFAKQVYGSWANGLHTELSVNGQVVGTFATDGVKPIGKFLKKGVNTIAFRSFSQGQTKDTNWLNFTIGPAVRKDDDHYEMTRVLWRYKADGDWKFVGGEYKHRIDPEAKDMTVTAVLYFGGLDREKPPGRGDYVLHVKPQYNSWNCPVSVTVAVNGTRLNSFLTTERSLAITSLLRKGENVVTVASRGVANDFVSDGNDLTVQVGGPAGVSKNRGGLTYPTLREASAKAALTWNDAKGVFVSRKDPTAAEGVQVLKFTLDEEPGGKGAAPVTPPAPEAAGDGPLATANHPKGLLVELLEVKADTREKLVIRWRYTNKSKKPVKLVEASGPFVVPLRSSPVYQFYNEAHYHEGKADSEVALRHDVLKYTDGKYDATPVVKGVVVPAEDSFEVWAKFSLPRNKVDTIAVQLPDIEPFEAVPFRYTPRK